MAVMAMHGGGFGARSSKPVAAPAAVRHPGDLTEDALARHLSALAVGGAGRENAAQQRERVAKALDEGGWTRPPVREGSSESGSL